MRAPMRSRVKSQGLKAKTATAFDRRFHCSVVAGVTTLKSLELPDLHNAVKFSRFAVANDFNSGALAGFHFEQ